MHARAGKLLLNYIIPRVSHVINNDEIFMHSFYSPAVLHSACVQWQCVVISDMETDISTNTFWLCSIHCLKKLKKFYNDLFELLNLLCCDDKMVAHTHIAIFQVILG